MTTDFRTLLKEAVKVSKRADELSKLHKLTAKAFLRDAMKIANTDNKKLDALEEALKKPLFESSRAFYRMAIKLLKEPNFTSPPKDNRLFRYIGRADEATAELTTIGSNLFELFALAVRDATKKFPESFGTVDDMEAHKREEQEVRLKRDECFKKIETTYTPADLRLGNIGKGGVTQITFEVSGGAVPLGEHSGERLVNWLKDHPEAVKTL